MWRLVVLGCVGTSGFVAVGPVGLVGTPPGRGRRDGPRSVGRRAAREVRVPDSTEALVASAARSVRAALEDGLTRQSVEVFLPLDPSVKPEDLDPWPGGLRQMLGTAVPIARAVLERAVPGCDAIDERTISAEDSVVQLVARAADPRDDASIVVFAAADHVEALSAIDEGCGPRRLLVLFNAQFDSPDDVGFFRRQGAAVKRVFGAAPSSLKTGRFPVTYCAQETSCRSEDVRVCYEHGAGWRAFVVADNVFDGQNLVASGSPDPLHDGTLTDRPDYRALEAMVIKKLPSPVYMRRLKEAADLGPRFSRDADS